MRSLGVCFTVMFSLLSSMIAQELANSRPNIVLVMTDDQGYFDLGCHGHPFVQTPNLDQLYKQSSRFVDFHASPSCAPTRAALMSGRAPFKNGITHTILERERMNLKATTIAQVLKTAGYTTGIFGKWHLGDDDEYQPNNRGFDEMFIHGAGGIGQNYPGTQGAFPGTSYFGPFIKHNDKVVKTKGYCTDVFFKHALGWMKKQQERLFFAYIALNAPHAPFIVADKYKNMYKDQKIADKSKSFYGMITNFDENMGLLMNKLDEWKLADNTLLIFMTDNGSSAGTWNGNMKGKKGSLNQGGSRVPLFMRLPGKIKAGVDIDKLTRHYDIFPTLAELAGASVSADLDLDGRSMVSLLKDPNAKWADRNLFFHKARWASKNASGRWAKGDSNPDNHKYKGFAVRNDKWRLVGKALYNIDKDPSEKKDVSKQHPEVVAEMMKAYEAWWTEVRPMMVNEDASLDTGKPYVELFNKQMANGGIPDWQEPDL